MSVIFPCWCKKRYETAYFVFPSGSSSYGHESCHSLLDTALCNNLRLATFYVSYPVIVDAHLPVVPQDSPSPHPMQCFRNPGEELPEIIGQFFSRIAEC